MRQIWGGLLCLCAGLVLAFTGVSGGTDAAAGVQICGIQVGVGTPCPVGTITLTETSVGDAPRPATWAVTIDSSNCPIVDATVDVPEGGQATSGDLFIYKDSGQGVPCSYTLTETPVAGYAPAFDPAGPYTLPDAVRGSNLAVALSNTGAVASTSPTVTASSSPTASATSSSGDPSTSPVATPSTPQLAATGTTTSVRWSLWLGVALCLAGAGLVATGWRRRGTHAG